ncbi:MAG: metallophosphoesterase family protein [Armatimonadetes bacterium]|nr:metallophosphoesterase family protein [Armatimonadota bacterium]
MRYAVISDIHSNVVALEAVLDELSGCAIDRYLCLGDIVGYGPRPNQCCDIIRELDCDYIRGNHDEAAVNPSKAEWFTAPARACIIWNRHQLREDNLEFLASLEPTRVVADSITICHGSVPEPDYYTVSPQDALLSFAAMTTRVGLFGHTHYAEWFAFGDGDELPVEHPHPFGARFTMQEDMRYLINPGAVGQPRDGNEHAAFAIYDDETGEVQLRRVEYDIESTITQMQEAGLPDSMWARLRMGV